MEQIEARIYGSKVIMKEAIYLPGLGDQKSRGEDKILKGLKFFGINTVYHKIGWRKRDFDRVFDSLKIEINAKSEPVSLICSSAGATVALNLLAEVPNKIDRIVMICGKANNLEDIEETYFLKNPNFKISVERLKKNLKLLNENSKVLCIYPIWDGVVPVIDAKLGFGAVNKRVWSFGHAFTIGYVLIFRQRLMAKFINS